VLQLKFIALELTYIKNDKPIDVDSRCNGMQKIILVICTGDEVFRIIQFMGQRICKFPYLNST
jgi:hypothetical protein